MLGCSPNKNIYNAVYDCQKKQNNYIANALRVYQRQLQYFNHINHSNNDTVYMLEMNGIQGNVLITLWNKNDTVSYTNENGALEKNKEPLFSEYMMTLVTEWNLPKINEEEKINSNLLPHEKIFATRIIFFKRNYIINCICFDEFFNINRNG